MEQNICRKNKALTVFAVISMILSSVMAATVPNEFELLASRYDVLDQHAKNCTFSLDETFAVTYCEDGYFAIDDTADLVNPETAFKVNANITFSLSDVPNDIRLDKYLAIVDHNGEKLTVIKRSTMEALHIELNSADAP